jgi:hypothetical protein
VIPLETDVVARRPCLRHEANPEHTPSVYPGASQQWPGRCVWHFVVQIFVVIGDTGLDPCRLREHFGSLSCRIFNGDVWNLELTVRLGLKGDSAFELEVKVVR